MTRTEVHVGVVVFKRHGGRQKNDVTVQLFSNYRENEEAKR